MSSLAAAAAASPPAGLLHPRQRGVHVRARAPSSRPGPHRVRARRDATATLFSSASTAERADDADAADADAATKPLTAVIVGGGLAGLAACVALRRIGIDAHVYERAQVLNTNAGTGITLWPNGLSAGAYTRPLFSST